jgi:hypothetical protein
MALEWRSPTAGFMHQAARGRQDARDESLDAIALCYHRRRQHASLGSVSPHNYEKCARVASLRGRFYLTTTS